MSDTLGARLRAAREHKGMTQQAVADDAAVSRAGVVQYESGAKTPALDTCKALADAVGVRAGGLAWGESPAPSWAKR